MRNYRCKNSVLEEGGLGSRTKLESTRCGCPCSDQQTETFFPRGARALLPTVQELCLLPLKSWRSLCGEGLGWGGRRDEVTQHLVWWFRQGVPHWVVPSPAPALPDCCLSVLLLELGLDWESALVGLQALSLMGKPILGFPVLPLWHSQKHHSQ